MPTEESDFIKAIQEQPNDLTLRLVFADWLEERGDTRAEYLRLIHILTQNINLENRAEREDRLRSMLEHGVQSPGPFYTNSVGMRFAWVLPGTFLMGSPDREGKVPGLDNQHKVTLTRGFYMGIHPVTQEQWQAVMGDNPSRFKGEKNLPVENVAWRNSQEFIKKLREKDLNRYRLPTEAEWEYACRAGTTSAFYFGARITAEQANYNVNRGQTTPVGSFPANAWGLYDMHGNILEWCQDWFGGYPSRAIVNPRGPKSGKTRVKRGGTWADASLFCSSESRAEYVNLGQGASGFRICFCPQ